MHAALNIDTVIDAAQYATLALAPVLALFVAWLVFAPVRIKA